MKGLFHFYYLFKLLFQIGYCIPDGSTNLHNMEIIFNMFIWLILIKSWALLIACIAACIESNMYLTVLNLNSHGLYARKYVYSLIFNRLLLQLSCIGCSNSSFVEIWL